MSFTYPQPPAPTFGAPGPAAGPPQGWAPGPPQPVAPQQPPPPAPSQDKGDTEGLALLTVAIIFHLLLNVYWLRADNHLIHLDEAHHINRAVAFHDALFPVERAGLFERGIAILGVESPYPPLTHLTGALFIRTLGYSPDTVAGSGSLFLALFLMGVYLFARQGTTARNAFMAALVAGFMPIIYGGSRYVMPDLLLAALVVWAMYALLKSDRFRKTGWVAAFAFFTGLAFLTKQTAFVYLTLPFLWVLGWGAASTLYPWKRPGVPLRRARAATLLFNATLCAFIVVGVCSWWYVRHVEYTHTWWSTQRGGESGLFQPGIASRIEFAMPENMEGAESRIYLDPAISRLSAFAPKEAPAPDNGTTDGGKANAPAANPPVGREEPNAAVNMVADTAEEAVAPGDDKGDEMPDDLLDEEHEAGLLTPLEPTIGEMPEPVEEETVDVASTEVDPAPSVEAPLEAERVPDTSLAAPLRQDWAVYPIHLVNDAAFLPVILVALFGLPALLLRRNRNALAFLLLVWLGGAYLLLTGMFTLRSPQLLFAVTPPVAVLCTLALDAVSRYRLRRALWGVLLFFMALAYINLTFFPLGPLKHIEIPVLTDHPAVMEQGNKGLAVHKDTVNLGHYLLHPPQGGAVVTEKLFERLVAVEEQRGDAAGPVAWYQVVSDTPAHLSMDFYARQYNRAALHGTADASFFRPFDAVKWESRAPEDTLPELAETEYVVLKQGVDGDYIGRLQGWVAFFKPHGFESIFNQRFEGYGHAQPGYVHALARRTIPALTDTLDIFEVYELLERDGAHWLLAEEERDAAEKRFARLVQEYTQIQPLTDQVNLLGFHLKELAENWYMLRLIVHCKEPVSQTKAVWLRATPHPDDQEALLAPHRDLDVLVWDFAPQPEAASWQRNQAIVLSTAVMAAPVRYQLEIGIYAAGKEDRPAIVIETDEWVDFAEER